VLAVQEGRDDLAKQALLRYNEHGRARCSCRKRDQAPRRNEKLKASLRQLNDKIEKPSARRTPDRAQKRAEAHKRIQETLARSPTKRVRDVRADAEQIEHEERKLIAAVGERGSIG